MSWWSHVELIACAAAEASGGACASGFAVAFGTELVAGSLGKGFVADPSLSAEDNEKAHKAYEQNRAAMVGALAGYVTSGGKAVNVSQGSSIARGAVTWNRQLHIQEAELIERYAADFAVEQGYCQDATTCSGEDLAKAKTELTGETLRGVSDDFAHLETNSAAREFLDGLAASPSLFGPQAALNGQHIFGVLDRNSEEYRNSTINMRDLTETYALYASIDKAALYAAASMNSASDPDVYSDPFRPSALNIAAIGVAGDLAHYSGTYGRNAAEAFFEANVRWGSEYVGWGDGLEQAFRNGTINHTDYLHIGDTSSNIRQAGIALTQINKEALGVLVQDGIVSSGELQPWAGRQFNSDGTVNVFWKTHQDNLLDLAVVQSVSIVGLAGYRSSLRDTGFRFTGGSRPALPRGLKWEQNADGSMSIRTGDGSLISGSGEIELIVSSHGAGLSNRARYMGGTPSRNSSVGKQVQQRMRSEGRLRGDSDSLEIQGADGQWYPIQQADMGHIVDAVDFWNQIGRFSGERSIQVRDFMLNRNNYVLEPSSINRSNGALSGKTYKPPSPIAIGDSLITNLGLSGLLLTDGIH